MLLILSSEKMMEQVAINWYAVELFFSVCEAGGITSAVRSGKAGISQPALSAQMFALEESLGHVLFERKPFRLTQVGTDFLREFSAIRRRMIESIDRVKSLHASSLRIAASDVVINNHLPKLLEKLQLPKTAKLSIKDASSHLLPVLVKNGDVDVAIGIMPHHAVKGKSPLAEVLMEVPIGLLMQKKKDGGPRTWQEIKKESLDLILLPEGNLIHEHVISSLRKKNINWKVTVEVTSLSQVSTFVGLGLGAGVQLSHVPNEKEKNLEWICIPKNIVPPIKIGIWYSENMNLLTKKILQLARDYTKGL